MARKKKKRKPFYQIVAKDIFEGSPFDLSKDQNGCKTLEEAVTCYRLRELNDVDKHKCWNFEIERVKGVFWPAIHYINDNPNDIPEYRNVHVHIHRPEGRRNNEFLALKINYRKARERNTDRLIRRVQTVARPAIKEIVNTQPERLTELQQFTTKLLLGS
jgi:hypothetical protein